MTTYTHDLDETRPAFFAAAATIGRYWRLFRGRFRLHYRPERHYMRGPGPKWREKHGG
jgi:hypothetical protein